MPKSKLGVANARLTGTSIVTNQLAGPPIGALLFTVGALVTATQTEPAATTTPFGLAPSGESVCSCVASVRPGASK